MTYLVTHNRSRLGGVFFTHPSPKNVSFSRFLTEFQGHISCSAFLAPGTSLHRSHA